MNWGVKISIVIGLFVALIVSLVTVCMRQTDMHLVASDYYEQEIGYQQTLDQMHNLDRSGARPSVVPAGGSVMLDFSQTGQYDNISGEIRMFRPSDPSLDFATDLRVGPDGKQQVGDGALKSGKWIAKLRWNQGGKEYYMEQSVMI